MWKLSFVEVDPTLITKDTEIPKIKFTDICILWNSNRRIIILSLLTPQLFAYTHMNPKCQWCGDRGFPIIYTDIFI